MSPIPTEGLALHLDASQLTGLSDNDPVGTWPDLSGNGNDMVSVSPGDVFVSSGVNGLPSVRGDGAGGFSRSPGFLEGEFGSVFLVWQPDTSSGSITLRQFAGFSDQLVLDTSWLGPVGVQTDASGPIRCDTPSPIQGLKVGNLIQWRSDGIATSITVNGVEQTLACSNGQNEWFDTTIGADSELFLTGLVGELIVYDGVVLSATQIVAVRDYLAEKWGVAVGSSKPARGLSLDGHTDSFAFTADKPALDIPTDIDIRIAFTFDNPGDPSPFGDAYLVERGASNNYQYLLTLGGGGSPPDWELFYETGAGYIISNGAPLVSLAPFGTPIAYRLYVVVDDGMGNTIVTFQVMKLTTGNPLAQIESDDGWATIWEVTDSTTPPSVPSDLYIGGSGDEDNAFIGTIYAVVVKDGINGTTVASPDFSSQAPGTTQFTDAQGNVWNLNGAAQITSTRRGTPSMTIREVTDSRMADFTALVVSDPKRSTLDAALVPEDAQADARVLFVTDENDADEFVYLTERRGGF